MSASSATGPGHSSALVVRARNLDCKGAQTGARLAIPRTAPWWWWKAQPLATFAPGRNHHDRHRRSSQYRRARPVRPGAVHACYLCVAGFSLASCADPSNSSWSRTRSAPSSLASSRMVPRWCPGSAQSRSRFCIVRLVVGLLLALAATRPVHDVTLPPAHIAVSLLNGGRRHLPSSAPSSPGGTAWARVDSGQTPLVQTWCCVGATSLPMGQWSRRGDSMAPSSVRLDWRGNRSCA